MERLWSPWRSQYISSFGTEKEYRGCVFCDALASDQDDERYVVARHAHCIAILNLYPYNSGHLMIVPNRHSDSFDTLSDEEYRDVMDTLRVWIRVLREVLHPQGFNIGSNIGRVAGAGIDQHIHMHIVPRWNGDSNFMPVLGDTKVISESMADTMHRLRAHHATMVAASGTTL